MADKMNLKIQLDLIDKATRESERVYKSLDKINKKVNQVSKSQKKLSIQTRKTNKYLSKTFKTAGKHAMKFGKVAAGIVAPAVGAMFVKGVKTAVEYENKMAEVSTLTDAKAKDFSRNFESIIESTQKAFGKDQQNVIKALYDGISAGVPATQKAAKAFLKATGKMAIAGATDMQTAGDAITSVQNAFRKKGVSFTFEQISNAMFGAVRAGKTTVTELSASVGQVATMAATTGTSLEEMFGSIAAITSKGVPTVNAVTQVNSALTALISPTKQAQESFEKLGIKGVGKFMSSFKNKKLFNTLKEIDKRLKKTTTSTSEYNTKLYKLFPNIRAYKGVLSLLADDQSKFASAIEATNKNAGQSNTAFEKMKTTALEMDQAYEGMEIAAKNLGKIVLPYWKQFVKNATIQIENLNDAIGAHTDLVTAQKLSKDKSGLIDYEAWGDRLAKRGSDSALADASRIRRLQKRAKEREANLKSGEEKDYGRKDTLTLFLEARGNLPEMQKEQLKTIGQAVGEKLAGPRRKLVPAGK